MTPGTLANWLIALATIGIAFVVGLLIDLALVAILEHEAGPGQSVRRATAKALRWQPEIWAVLLGYGMLKPFAFLSGRTVVWVDRLVTTLAVVAVTFFLARLAGWLIRFYLRQETVSAPSGTIFVNLARLVIWAIGLTFMLGALGVQIGPLVASLGVAGLAVSLGLQDTLANFFAGLQITTSRQIQPGEYIRLSTGEEGAVVDVTWRNTTLRSPSNDLVVVPNSVIGRAQITNFTSQDEEHVTAVPFTVAFGSDLDEVKRIALSVAREVRDEMPDAVKEFDPTCRFRGFGPEGMLAAVTIRIDRYQDRAPVVSEVVERLHRALAEGGIELAGGASVTPSKPA